MSLAELKPSLLKTIRVSYPAYDANGESRHNKVNPVGSKMRVLNL